MQQMIDVRIAPNGRMVLPKSARTALGLTGEGVISLSVEGDEVKLSSMQANIKHAQALYRAHVKTDQSSDGFLADRREEDGREEGARNAAKR
jgi:bifunctional DNA-binding transcriptional regulator/antitoxin component of YhaV-PrlF toxin-antitoxin module